MYTQIIVKFQILGMHLSAKKLFHRITYYKASDFTLLQDFRSRLFFVLFFALSPGCVSAIPDTARQENFTGHSLPFHKKQPYCP